MHGKKVMLSINILKKEFEKNLVLNDINIEIKDREFISFIGPSGCGKSTLLNILAKLDTRYIGEIKNDFENISFVFQDDRLVPWLNIKDNLLLISKTKDIKQIQELLKIVKLEDTIDKFPNQLSGGMRRRIAIIRAFINNPELILLDEPFTSLDYPTAMDLKKEFLNLCKDFNPIVILVTHDISEAILFSHRIFFLSKNPANIILEYKNLNNQEFNNKKIDEIKNSIFDDYPNILKGEI